MSAKYGVLKPDDLIRTYDHRLDLTRDWDLIVSTRRKLDRLWRKLRPRRVLTLLGRDYRACLPSTWVTLNIEHADGPPGRRVRQMLDWLGSGAPCA